MAELPPADPDAPSGDRCRRGGAAAGRRSMKNCAQVDPVAAAERINPNDSQRIQRALEVYRTERPCFVRAGWNRRQIRGAVPRTSRTFEKLALQVEPRSLLHERIALRLERMLEAGFLDEIRGLMQRPGLRRESAAMRAVGYRQFWAHLAGECSIRGGFEPGRWPRRDNSRSGKSRGCSSENRASIPSMPLIPALQTQYAGCLAARRG